MSLNDKPPITDSPWFWVLLFSIVGLIALGGISGQYGKRQARLERQYQARERIAAGEVGDNAGEDPERQGYATSERTLVPIWPLAVVVGGAAVFAAVMLRREWRSRDERVPPVASTGVAQPPEASGTMRRIEMPTSAADR
jgi:hypothetical protein